MTGDGGARLRTLEWAPSPAPHGGPAGRVVLVHGLGEHAGRYGDLARRLAERGFQVVGYDQRGHGASEGRRGVLRSFDVLLRDLDRVMTGPTARFGSAGAEVPVFFLGHSMGALVVLRYLQEYTRRPAGAVLSAPWLATRAPISRWRRVAATILRRWAPDWPIRSGIEPSALTRDPERQRAYTEDPLVHHRISVGLFDAVAKAQERILERETPRLPFLFLLPMNDPIADVEHSERFARSLDGDSVRVERLAGMRHEPFQETDRGRVEALVAEWLEAR